VYEKFHKQHNGNNVIKNGRLYTKNKRTVEELQKR